MRYAAIDIGSNTVQMMIASPGPSGLTERTSGLRTTRLGSGKGQALLPAECIRETVAAVSAFMEQILAEQVAGVRILATSAVRDAENREQFCAAIAQAVPAAPPVEVLTGEEEARTSYLGVRASLSVPDAWPIIDLGGSSTELIYQDDQGLHCVSGNLGAVRAHVNSWTAADIRERVLAAYPVPSSAGGLIGVGGTITTAAGVLAGLDAYDRTAIEGMELTAKELDALLSRLLPLTEAERCAYSPLLERRGEIMAEGLEIWLALMAHLGIDKLVVCGGGLLDGAIWQMATGEEDKGA